MKCHKKSVQKKGKSKGQWCSAINCKNNRSANKDISFFRFPKDKQRCKKWVMNSRREDLLKYSFDHLSKSNVLCANHFEESQFTPSKQKNLKRNHRTGEIPTLFDVPTKC